MKKLRKPSFVSHRFMPTFFDELVIFCISATLSNAFSLEEEIKNKSANMMHDLKEEIDCLQYVNHMCEQNAFNAIQRLTRMNTSHPIKDGISLIYFIRKSHRRRYLNQDPLFGSTKIEWSYHCCLGFKDLYLDTDWLIDLSYHCMVLFEGDQRKKRLISKKEYLPNIPHTVDLYVIPIRNLEYFINRFVLKFFNALTINLTDFLEIKDRPCFIRVFDTSFSGSSDFSKIEQMMNNSVIFKFESVEAFYLPL